ncbi:dihydrodipicolinate synthase family protein [Arsenicitalea aurantiaca]|uniref:Dihydrodipicolinate synthase family protein n=1 Tax=Arsenicitalea aurantiaca TaxID=1783274 RepID=A0A433XB25_9HYPH|nr:dihydrodipicolinate synthase family protein [Arsenicitalea aurantiaca]RUT31275.1 dihydrodipicolinate synthase family protein [Arsenicitalea aurantiaca]
MSAEIASRLGRTVVAVPPVAWTDRLELAEGENRKLIAHIEAGGVGALLYGGNANLYHFDLGRFDALMALLAEAPRAATDVIVSIGPDLGKLLDEADRLKDHSFAGVMALPMTFPTHPEGIEKGLRLAADRLGGPLILYIKREHYLAPDRVASLVKDGAVNFVKYAVERTDPRGDAYLSDLCSAIGPDIIASGMGETPIHVHLPEYRVRTYTSGGVCIAPRAAMALLAAHRAGDMARATALAAPFLAFEKVRAAINGFSVMHDAVTLSGIANMGPILPMAGNVPQGRLSEVQGVVDGLVALDKTCQNPG